MRIRFSPLLAPGARTMVPVLALFSFSLLAVGHDRPGGGFAGGLVAAAAVLLVYLAFGERGVRRALRIRPEILTGIGLGIAVAAGIVGLAIDGVFLQAQVASVELPLVGTVKATSMLMFDAGVYGVVVGLVATGIVRLGGEERT